MTAPLLAIETSGRSLGVALRTDSGLLFEENVQAGAIHGKALAPLIKKALDSQQLKAQQLAAVAVSLGPGSWTGLRIGISAAKTLAWGAGIKLVGVPSFEALALDAARHAPNSARLLLRDARSEGYFVALFGETEEPAERWIEERVLKSDEAIAAAEEVMAKHSGVALSICGDRVCLDQVQSAAQKNGWNVLTACEHVSAGSIAECGWKRLKAGGALTDAAEIHKLSPLYLRASDPELKLKARLSGHSV